MLCYYNTMSVINKLKLSQHLPVFKVSNINVIFLITSTDDKYLKPDADITMHVVAWKYYLQVCFFVTLYYIPECYNYMIFYLRICSILFIT